MPRLKIMLSVTEVSGDLQGASLVRAIKRICPSVEFIGIGGEKMKEAGVDIRAFTTHMGTIGLIEALKYYPSFLKIRSNIEKMLQDEHPDLVILIDSRDFNLKLIELTGKLQIPTVYYIAPPIWAWSDWKMKRMSRKVGRIIAIFPFGAEAYKQAGANVIWVGHPLLDIVKLTMSKEEVCRKFGLNPYRPIVGLLPGSREYEINSLLPVMLSVAQKLSKRIQGIQYLLPVAASTFQEQITKIVERNEVEVKILNGNIYNLMNISTLLLTASGTATLEAACLGIPMVIMYKAHITTYLLGQILLRVPYIGLPNILAGKEIVPELLQFKVREGTIVNTTLDLLINSEKLSKMKGELKEVVKKLGSPGAVDRAARVVVEMVDSTRS